MLVTAHMCPNHFIWAVSLSHWSHFDVYQVHLLIDQINAAIVDFNKAVTLQPNFPVAYVQKLYTDYR